MALPNGTASHLLPCYLFVENGSLQLRWTAIERPHSARSSRGISRATSEVAFALSNATILAKTVASAKGWDPRSSRVRTGSMNEA